MGFGKKRRDEENMGKEKRQRGEKEKKGKRQRGGEKKEGLGRKTRKKRRNKLWERRGKKGTPFLNSLMFCTARVKH